MISAADVTGEWLQEGAFLDADGKSVSAYDDVVVSRPVQIQGGVLAIGGERTAIETVPAGSTGTVLFFTAGADGVAQLELRPPEGGFGFGYEQTALVHLHMTNEEKYPR